MLNIYCNILNEQRYFKIDSYNKLYNYFTGIIIYMLFFICVNNHNILIVYNYFIFYEFIHNYKAFLFFFCGTFFAEIYFFFFMNRY